MIKWTWFNFTATSIRLTILESSCFEHYCQEVWIHTAQEYTTWYTVAANTVVVTVVLKGKLKISMHFISQEIWNTDLVNCPHMLEWMAAQTTAVICITTQCSMKSKLQWPPHRWCSILDSSKWAKFLFEYNTVNFYSKRHLILSILRVSLLLKMPVKSPSPHFKLY